MSNTLACLPSPTPSRSRSLLAVVIVIFALLGAATASVLTSPGAWAATRAVDQCNGVGPDASGATTGMTCTVEVWNTIDRGHTSSVLTLTRRCSLGPCAPGNGSFTTRSTSLVTDIKQCNGSDNDAAHPITCTIKIHNSVSSDTPGARPVSAATVNQCVGSAQGGGGSTRCAPYPANTTNATVTQCNGSANGGGGTIACTVGSASRITRAIPVQVNQCNGTGNPGGSTVTCSVTIDSVVREAAPTPTPTSGAAGTPGAGGTTSTSGSTSSTSGTPDSAGLGGSPQVQRVPHGGVQAGGGLSAGTSSERAQLLGLLLLFGGSVAALRACRAHRAQ